MDSLEEIYKELDQEETLEPRPRPVEKRVAHQTDVGRLVYEIIGPKAPSLYYVHSNNFVSGMLQDGWQFWSIEAKLKDALTWCRKKRANYAGLRTLLKKIRETAK